MSEEFDFGPVCKILHVVYIMLRDTCSPSYRVFLLKARRQFCKPTLPCDGKIKSVTARYIIYYYKCCMYASYIHSVQQNQAIKISKVQNRK
jgi:hypothetical protein